jgi:RimJ/RimL family protein N-acetyltransferase
MSLDPAGAPITTRRLKLVTLEAPFVDAITLGDRSAAERLLGARVSRSLASDPSHIVQLDLAGRSAAAAGYPGFARLILLSRPIRQTIGSIGFHGPPDEAGRLEVGCRIHPAHHGSGYGAEATTALLDWATRQFGVTRFLLAVPWRQRTGRLVPIEIQTLSAARHEEIDGLGALLEGERPRA